MAYIDPKFFSNVWLELPITEDKLQYLYNNAHRVMQRHAYQKSLEHKGLMGYFA